MSTTSCSLLSLGCVFGYVAPGDSTLTALRALEVAQRRLRPEVRSKLLSIASARTDATLTPEAWRFVFLDQTTSGHCRVVTVASKASSQHPDVVEAFRSIPSESVRSLPAIRQKQLLFDSNMALQQVRRKARLKGVLLVEYRLLQQPEDREPVWLLSFYGKTPEPRASFHVGAETGATESCSVTADPVP